MKTTKRKRDTSGSSGKAKRPATPVAAAPAIEPAAQAPLPSAPVGVSAPAPVVGTSESALVLASICSVREAAALKDSLVQLLETPDVVVDASSLERIDTATLQLLCAFVRDRAKANLTVSWKGESTALRDAARLLGVTDMLALSAGAAA